MNDGIYDNMKEKLKFNIDYNYVENQFKLEIIDLRPIANQNGDVIEVYLLTYEDLLTDKWDGPRLHKEYINSMNQIIRLTKTKVLNSSSLEEDIFYTNI